MTLVIACCAIAVLGVAAFAVMNSRHGDVIPSNDARICAVAEGPTFQGTELQALANQGVPTEISRQALVAVQDFSLPIENGSNAAQLRGWDDLITMCVNAGH